MVTHRLQVEDFNALTDRANAVAEAAFIARWGSGPALRKGTLRALVAILVRRPGFIDGKRAAYSVPKLARDLRKHRRSVERAIDDLRLFPELVAIDVIASGQPNWAGRRSWFTHLEYRAGRVLQAELDATLASLLADTPGVTPTTPRRHADYPPGVTPVDQSLDPSDLELQLKSRAGQPPRSDRPNFELVGSGKPTSPLQLAAEPPAPTPPQTCERPPEATRTHSPGAAPSDRLPLPTRPQEPSRRLAPPPAPQAYARDGHFSGRPGLASAKPRPFAPTPPASPPVFTHSIQLIEDVVRQHRRIADPKSPSVPIDDEERLRVDGALRLLTSCRTDQEKLDLCARVSELAARKTRANGKPANVKYAFGGPDDAEPHRYFLERVADLREIDEQARRRQADSEWTATVHGHPRPARAAPPQPRRPRPHVPTPRPQPTELLSTAATQAAIADAMARMELPYSFARAG